MKQELLLRIILENPPAGVDYGIQKGGGSLYETIQIQKSSGKSLVFEFPITVKFEEDGLPNFLGAFVQGPSGQRFIYVDIGTLAGQKETSWSRRLKIPLTGIGANDIREIISDPGKILETKVPGIGKDHGPNCGTVKPFEGWHLSTKY